MGAYSRVTVDGKTLNKRTKKLYNQVKDIYPLIGGEGTLWLSQGSYNTSVSASGNTHAGGGAIDVMILGSPSDKNYKILEKAARMCMFADWDRPELWRNGKKVWGHHNHGIAIGDREASPSAKNQVHAYFADEDGLVTGYEDTGYKPRVVFTPPQRIRNVNLKNVRREAKKRRYLKVPTRGVARVQKALNIKLGTDLRVNGIFNKKTKAAFARWEQTVGGNGDGIPSRYTLTLLGGGRFNVV